LQPNDVILQNRLREKEKKFLRKKNKMLNAEQKRARDQRLLELFASRAPKIMESLLKEPENKECADCRASRPRSANITFGVFICEQCAGAHKSLAAGSTIVKSVNRLSEWVPSELSMLSAVGNRRANVVLEAIWPPFFQKPDAKSLYRDKEQYILQKYDHLSYCDPDSQQPVIRYAGRTSEEIDFFVDSSSSSSLSLSSNGNALSTSSSPAHSLSSFASSSSASSGSAAFSGGQQASSSLSGDSIALSPRGGGDGDDGGGDDDEFFAAYKAKTGFLNKKGGDRRNWKRRFFVLTDAHLAYYKSAHADVPVGVIQLALSKVRPAPVEDTKKAHCFQLVRPNRVYLLQADSKEEVDDWVNAIRTVSYELSHKSDTRSSAAGMVVASTRSGAARQSSFSFANNPSATCGFLHKKDKRWHRYWFYFEPSSMALCAAASSEDAQRGTQALWKVNLLNCMIRSQENYGRRFSFQLVEPERAHLFAADDAQQCAKWLDALHVTREQLLHSFADIDENDANDGGGADAAAGAAAERPSSPPPSGLPSVGVGAPPARPIRGNVLSQSVGALSGSAVLPQGRAPPGHRGRGRGGASRGGPPGRPASARGRASPLRGGGAAALSSPQRVGWAPAVASGGATAAPPPPRAALPPVPSPGPPPPVPPSAPALLYAAGAVPVPAAPPPARTSLLSEIVSHDKKQLVRNDSEQAMARLGMPLKKGFMHKMGHNKIKDWRKRWVLLNDDSLAYFRNVSDSTPAGCISLVTGHAKPYAKREHGIAIVTPNRTYFFAADTAADQTGWINAINAAAVRTMDNYLAKDEGAHAAAAAMADGGGGASSSSAAAGGAGASPADGIVEFQGYLAKRGHNMIKDWRKRWVVIKIGSLYYYESKEASEPLGKLNLLLCTVKRNRQKDTFDVVLPNRTYFFRAKNGSEMLAWIDAIRTASERVYGELGTAAGDAMQATPAHTGSSSAPGVAMASASASAAAYDYKGELAQLLESDASSRLCADCGERDPRWASTNLGIYVCIECSGIHRSLGVHLSRVRSVDLDKWERSAVDFMRSMGNAKANAIWEHTLASSGVAKPTPGSDREAKERFIADKYIEMKWADMAHVPAELVQLKESSGQQTAPTTQIAGHKKFYKCGYMQKCGGSVKTWKRRWFVLKVTQRAGNLFYYKQKDDANAAGAINLAYSIVRISTAGKFDHAFEIITQDRVYQLVADNSSDMSSWIQTLREVVTFLDASLGDAPVAVTDVSSHGAGGGAGDAPLSPTSSRGDRAKLRSRMKHRLKGKGKLDKKGQQQQQQQQLDVSSPSNFHQITDEQRQAFQAGFE
jgi:Putative GTPase activating protein for Arf/PH domain